MEYVVCPKKSLPSGLALDNALVRAGYSGPRVRFGFGVDKRTALIEMTAAGVPTLYMDHAQRPFPFPVVARPDWHHAGQYFYLCHDDRELARAMRPRRQERFRASHVQLYLPDALEFRVHIVNGRSVKISGKDGGGNHSLGATFAYPHDFHHKKSLRTVAKLAVQTLGMEIGAVDILWKDSPYVLEVNAGPRLTDPLSDTLERYVRAIMHDAPVASARTYHLTVSKLSTALWKNCG